MKRSSRLCGCALLVLLSACQAAPVPVRPGQLKLAWQANLGGPVDGKPAVAGGVVFAGSEAGQLAAIDLRSGRVAWRDTGLGAITDSPAVAAGLVVAGTQTGKVDAFDAGTGRHVWSWSAPGDRPAIWSSPVVWHGEVLVASSSQYGDIPLEAGRLGALDLHTGRQLWIECVRADCAPGDGVWSTPAVDDAGRAYVGLGNPDDGVLAFDARTGRVLWRHSFYADLDRDLDVGATPLLVVRGSTEAVDVGSTAGVFKSLDAADGHELWSRDLVAGSAVHGLIGSPVSDGAALYVPSASPPNGIISLTEDGARRWSAATAEPVYGAPALAGGELIAGTGAVFGDRSAGALVVIRNSDGAIISSWNTGSAVNSSPAIADGYIVAGDYGGKVLAFVLGS